MRLNVLSLFSSLKQHCKSVCEYKILKIIPFGLDDCKMYTVFYCGSSEYNVFSKLHYFNNSVIVYDLHECKVGDSIRIKTYYNLDDFEDKHYEIYKNY